MVGSEHEVLTSNSQHYVLNRMLGRFNAFGLLLLFATINLLTYFDRGAFAGSQDALKVDPALPLNDWQRGVLGGAYIVGYTVAAPIFAQLVAYHKPIRVMCAGLTMWTVSVVFTGTSFRFGTLLVARTLSGVGEASFLVVAPTFIDVFSPPSERSRWLSWFYVTIPVGYALGVVTSGNWIGGNLEGREWTWRLVFFFEAVAMLPLIATFLTVDGPDTVADLDPQARARLYSDEHHDAGDHLRWGSVKRVIGEVKEIVSNSTYDFIVLGYAFQTFVIGGFSYYGDEYAKNAIHLSDSKASICFGGVTLISGISGTAFGGYILHLMRSRHPSDQQACVRDAVSILAVSTVFAIPVTYLSLVSTNPWAFFVPLGCAEFLLFASMSPVTSSVLWLLPLERRPFAVSLSVMVQHALGDCLSPVLIGLLLESTNDNWVFCIRIMVSWLFLTLICWTIAYILSNKTITDRRKSETMNELILPIL